jgi:hypothetical protein
VVAVLVALAAVTSSIAPPSRADAASAYVDGAMQYSHIYNCPSVIQNVPFVENGAASYVGYLADTANGQPSVNQTYYVRIVVSAIGTACSGQYADVQFKLPSATAAAISSSTPVRCHYDQIVLTDCPQTLTAGSQDGLFRLRAATSDGLWPLPIGRIVTIQVPVRSSSPLGGAPFTGFVTLYDGNSTPTLTPNVGVSVSGSGNPGNAQPALTYPNPSTTNITSSAAISRIILDPDGVAGNVWFELSKLPDMSTILFSEPPLAVAAGQTGTLTGQSDWRPYPLESGTRYYWRSSFTPSDGSPSVHGAIQTFTTSAGAVHTVGTGTAASCTAAALATAVSSASTTIKFNCGPQPVTIALTSSLTLTNKTIDGDDRVTLTARAGARHFTMTGTSTLEDLSLTGASHNECGGAIRVAVGASATFTSGRISGNTTGHSGGGVCVESGANFDVYDSTISHNTAGAAGGGIHSLGNLTFLRSEATGNSAGGNGGGLSLFGSADIRQVALVENTAGGSAHQTALGGGIYSNGSLSILTATLSGNTAGDGAAIATNDGGFGVPPASTWIINATIADNVARSATGAALRIAGSGTGAIRNTLVAPNTPRNCATSAGQRRYTSLGNSHDSGTSCGFTAGTDRSNVAARLAPLAFNEGPIATRTHALLPGSSAIDAADNVHCGFSDQRGVGHISAHGEPGRDIDGDGNGTSICDVGAFELKPDGTAPTATAITRLDPSPTSSASVRWRIDFSEPVTGVDAADFAVAATGVTGASITAVSPAASAVAMAWTVTATTGSGATGTTRLDLRSTATIRDASNVALTAGRQGPAYSVDRSTPPTTTPPTTTPPTTTPPTTPPGSGSGSGLAPIVPARLLDTRTINATIDGQSSGIGLLPAGSTTEVQITGRAGIAPNATAASLNVTIVDAKDIGYATVYPCDAPRPTASNLNYQTGDVVPNAVLTKLSTTGTICIYTHAPTHLLIDANATFR